MLKYSVLLKTKSKPDKIITQSSLHIHNSIDSIKQTRNWKCPLGFENWDVVTSCMYIDIHT